jgi:hypothetical protein
LGALWAFYSVAAVRITSEPGATDAYVWGKASRRFVRCRTCGCTTHVEPTSPTPESELEVNLRIFEPAVLGQFRVRFFDGANTWKYLDETHTASSNGGA